MAGYAKSLIEKWAALYVRLSRDDDNDGDSNSISHQVEILTKYAKEHGIENFKIYKDDGFSGTNFNRPGFQEMMGDIENGLVSMVVVKDMSRFGRNYLEVGMYTEIRFPEMGVRFIAVNDGVDSEREDNDFTPEYHQRMVCQGHEQEDSRCIPQQGNVWSAHFHANSLRLSPQ